MNFIILFLFTTSLWAQNYKLKEIRSQYQDLFDFTQLDKIKIKKEIKIATIDTGIDIKNPEFKKRIWIPSFIKAPRAFGWDTTKNNAYPHDTNGHGSHITGILISIFPQAKIFPINYYDEKATNDESEKRFVEAIKVAIRANVDIINISGGGPKASADEFAVLKMAELKGIVVVTAAGNFNWKLKSYSDTQNFFPAAYNLDNIVSVMNNEHDQKEDNSNYGDLITTSAPGSEIKSFNHNGKFLKMTGTSQSAPVVTALCAYLKAFYPAMSVPELKLFLKLGTKKLSHFINYNQNSGVIKGTKALYALSEYLKFRRGEFGPSLEKFEQELAHLLQEQKETNKKLALAAALESKTEIQRLRAQEFNTSFKLFTIRKNKKNLFLEEPNQNMFVFESYFHKRNQKIAIE